MVCTDKCQDSDRCFATEQEEDSAPQDVPETLQIALSF